VRDPSNDTFPHDTSILFSVFHVFPLVKTMSRSTSLRSDSISTTTSVSTASQHSRSSSSNSNLSVGRKLVFSGKPTLRPRTSCTSSNDHISDRPQSSQLSQSQTQIFPLPTLIISPPAAPPQSDLQTSAHLQTSTPSTSKYSAHTLTHHSLSHDMTSSSSSSSYTCAPKRDTLSSISMIRSALRGSRRNSQ